MTLPPAGPLLEDKPLKRHPKCSSFYSVRARSQDAETAAPAPLAPTIAYLEQLSMHMTVSKALKGGPQYAMTVHHTKTKATWRHCRDFEEYKTFQSRLVATMQRGHFCFAECPWLFSFVKRAFPKPSFFNYASPRVVELRRKALSSFFNTLQAVLLNRANHCCSVLTDAVAKEFVGFVYGDASHSAPWEHLSPAASRGGILARTFSETCMTAAIPAVPALSSASISSLTSDEESDEREDTGHNHTDHYSSERECCAMCALHHVRSDEQVFSWWQAKNRFAKASSSSSGASTASSLSSSLTSSHGSFGLETQSDKSLQSTRHLSLDITLVSEPVESPQISLADTAVLGGDDGIAVLGGHDGTPKEAYPGTPTTTANYPAGWTTSSLSSPLPPHMLSFLRDDEDENECAKSKKAKASAAAQSKRGRSPFHSVPTPTVLHKRLCKLPRRSLNVLSSVSNAISLRLKPQQQQQSPNTVV